MGKLQARENIKEDFDKDAAVDLLCNRIDELEYRLNNVGGHAHLAMEAFYTNRVTDLVKHIGELHIALYQADFPVTDPQDPEER